MLVSYCDYSEAQIGVAGVVDPADSPATYHDRRK